MDSKKKTLKIGKIVVKHRRLILIVAFLLLIPSVLGYLATGINYDMLTYLPKDMETMKGQSMLLDDFGKGGFTIVVMEDMSDEEVKETADAYRKVKDVTSVLNMNDLLDSSIPRETLPDLVTENLDNEDATMVVCFFDTSTSDEASLDAIREIRKISSKKCFVSGMSALVEDLKELCETEEPKYAVIAVGLSLAAMMLFLDSFLAPILFILSIGMAIIYNLGSNIVFGETSYITKAIAAVLQLGVTMDYSIFIWHAFMEHMDQGKEKEEAMEDAVDDALTAVTGSSVTTVAGFLALCFMTYTMGMDLGIVMAKGVVIGVAASLTVLPALLLALSGPLRKTRHRTLLPDTKKLAEKLTGKYVVFILIFAILFVPAIYGYSKENVVYDFTQMLSGSGMKDLSDDQIPFRKANEKLYEHFGINSTHMIIADADLPPHEGHKMVKEIQDVDGVENVLGLDAFTGELIPREILPSKVTESLIAGDNQLILVNSGYKVSTDECNEQIEKISKIMAEYDKEAKIIGEGPATRDLITLTDKDFKLVNLISILAVFIIILFVTRSWLLPVILIATIEFAIYVNLGIPGYTGIELPFIIPVIISTIQLGSTVDYAILMSTRYKSDRMSGMGRKEAVVNASAKSTPSIIVSGVGFFTATFGVGIYSNIGIISTVCGLMARGAIISMLTVILVLPSLLMAFDKYICKTTKGMKDIYVSESIA